MKHHNACRRCGCPLDAGEGNYCEDCIREMREDQEYSRRWCLTMEQVRELRREGLIGA